MDVRFKISRFDPDRDRAPYFQPYTVSADSNERVLDCLNRIRWEQDGTLAYRMSCGHGVCGSCAVKINGRCTLACQRLVKDYGGREVVLEPLPSFRVLKDLIVDLEPFFQKVRLIRPYLLSEKVPPEKERLQSPAESKKVEAAIRCILCACCMGACPVVNENEQFVGPSSLVWAFRFIFDSRDDHEEERLKEIDSPNGAWGCVNHFECTRACPKEILITKSINTIKQEIQKKLKDES